MNKKELKSLIRELIQESKSQTKYNGFEYPELPGKGKFVFADHDKDQAGFPRLTVMHVPTEAEYLITFEGGTSYNVTLIDEGRPEYPSDERYEDKKVLDEWAQTFKEKNSSAFKALNNKFDSSKLADIFYEAFDHIQELQDAIRITLPTPVDFDGPEWEEVQDDIDRLSKKVHDQYGFICETRLYVRGSIPLGSNNNRKVQYVNIVIKRGL